MMEREVGRLADETFRLSLRLAETMTLLSLAASYSWTAMVVEACRAAGRAGDDRVRRQARTARLMSRGVPVAEASRGLRLV